MGWAQYMESSTFSGSPGVKKHWIPDIDLQHVL